MKLHLIRHATIILDFGGKRFLIDPMFAPKGYCSPIANNSSPSCDLPLPEKDIVKNVDAVIITHLHSDHFDEFAEKALQNDIKIFVQDEFDKNALMKSNFKNIELLSSDGTDFCGVTLYKTPCLHGIKVFAEPVFLSKGMRWEAIGVVFKSNDEPVLYLAGDSLWYEGVRDTIDKYKPDYAILNADCAEIGRDVQVTMGVEDIKELHAYAPDTKLVASHMDNAENSTLTRADLKSSEVGKYIYTPIVGEILV